MASARAKDPLESLDGRLARSERSRAAIVDAMLALVGEGVPYPTAEQVAARARVGIRTVFRHFRDMESVFSAMSARIEQEVAPRFALPPIEGSLEERLRELVARRCRLYETIAPYQRASALRRIESPFLRSRQAALVKRLRTFLFRWIPELEGARAEVVEALDLLTSFEAWDRLRSEQRLGPARARAALECAALALAPALRR